MSKSIKLSGSDVINLCLTIDERKYLSMINLIDTRNVVKQSELYTDGSKNIYLSINGEYNLKLTGDNVHSIIENTNKSIGYNIREFIKETINVASWFRRCCW